MFNKKADKDYTTDKLPDNRFKLFWDLYANRISLILGVGLLCLLFLLPSFAVTIISNLKVYKINLELNSGYTTASEAASDIFATINTANLALVPCLALLGVGVAGICGVLRRLTWQDGVLFWHDFRQSIKENGGIFASTAAICGGLNWATQYCLRLQHFDNGTLAQVSLAVAIVATVLFAVVAPMLLCQSLVYKLSYFAKLKNAFMLSMRQPLVSFGLLVDNAAPWLLLLIDNKYTFVAFLVLLPVVVMPAQLIADIICCDIVLDKYVNKDNFPQIYRKGLNYDASDNNA